MKVPNVVVVSRMGELLGICWYRPRKVSVNPCGVAWRPEDETYHVISDVHAENSSLVVHKCCRVGGESRHGDVQHVVILGWQRKGWSRERRFLMLPDVVKLALNEEENHYDISLSRVFSGSEIKFSFTFNFKLILEVEMVGEDTMEYSISACLSTFAKTAVW